MRNESAPTSRKQTTHPPYLQMITEALETLKERTGSSVPAMAKFLEQKYGESLPENFRKMLTLQLKKLVKSEHLVKVKNSFKLASGKRTKSDNSKSKDVNAAAVTNKKDMSKAESSKPGKTVNQKKSQKAKVSEAKKVVKKAIKTKRLSLVKSPAGTIRTKKKGDEKVVDAKEKPMKVAAKSAAAAPDKPTKKKSAVAAKK